MWSPNKILLDRFLSRFALMGSNLLSFDWVVVIFRRMKLILMPIWCAVIYRYCDELPSFHCGFNKIFSDTCKMTFSSSRMVNVEKGQFSPLISSASLAKPLFQGTVSKCWWISLITFCLIEAIALVWQLTITDYKDFTWNHGDPTCLQRQKAEHKDVLYSQVSGSQPEAATTWPSLCWLKVDWGKLEMDWR